MQFQKNAPTDDRGKDGRKDGQALFHWTYPGTAGGPIITEARNLSHGYTLPLSFTTHQTLKIYAANFRFIFQKINLRWGFRFL